MGDHDSTRQALLDLAGELRRQADELEGLADRRLFKSDYDPPDSQSWSDYDPDDEEEAGWHAEAVREYERMRAEAEQWHEDIRQQLLLVDVATFVHAQRMVPGLLGPDDVTVPARATTVTRDAPALDRSDTHICVVDGRRFTGVRVDAKFCSNACRQRAYRERTGA